VLNSIARGADLPDLSKKNLFGKGSADGNFQRKGLPCDKKDLRNIQTHRPRRDFMTGENLTEPGFPELKTEFNRMRHHLTHLMLRRLVKSRVPAEALTAIKDNAEVVAGIIHGEMGIRGKKASRQAMAGSVMIGGSLLYWAGWIALPLWVPALGAAVGTLGAAGVVAGFKWWRDAHMNDAFLKTYYSFLQMMEMADGVVTAEEGNHLNDFLLSLPLSAGQRKAFLEMPVAAIETVEVPAWFEPLHREAILAGCWSLAFCDGIAGSEEILFARMAERLAVAPEVVQRLKDEVARLTEENEEILLGIGEQAAALLPQADGVLKEAMVKILAAVNARSDPEERLRTALTFSPAPPIQASLLESKILSDTVLSGAYLVAYGLNEWDEDYLQTIRESFLKVCSNHGRAKEASEWMRLAEEALSQVIRS